MRVLVATGDATFNVALMQAYRSRGWDVHVGQTDLFLKQISFDLVHVHWPEELVGWSVPPHPGFAERTLATLDWWRSRTKLMCTVHNLRPHAFKDGDTKTISYFVEFYKRMHTIGHFSETSLAKFREYYPELSNSNHVVHGMNLFDNLKPLGSSREVARTDLGLREGDFAISILGAVRLPAEQKLLMQGIALAEIPAARILFATKPIISRRPLLKQWQLAKFRRWLLANNGIHLSEFLQDEEMVNLLRASDALIISRFGHQINSGLLPLTITFGTPIVAPDFGIFRETLSNTLNSLYIPGDKHSLAQSIEKISKSDIVAVRASNLAIADTWGWSKAIDRLTEATLRNNS